MKLLAKFNIILLVIFGAGGLLIAHFAYNFLVGNARREVLEEAQMMMANAKAVRDYTQDDLSPLLQQNPQHSVRFLAETVPNFAAASTFEKLRDQYPSYTYHEAALNPTNVRDRATDWEAEVIEGLRRARISTRRSANATLPRAGSCLSPTPFGPTRDACSATAFLRPHRDPC